MFVPQMSRIENGKIIYKVNSAAELINLSEKLKVKLENYSQHYETMIKKREFIPGEAWQETIGKEKYLKYEF